MSLKKKKVLPVRGAPTQACTFRAETANPAAPRIRTADMFRLIVCFKLHTHAGRSEAAAAAFRTTESGIFN